MDTKPEQQLARASSLGTEGVANFQDQHIVNVSIARGFFMGGGDHFSWTT